jgi:hypothetical protein
MNQPLPVENDELLCSHCNRPSIVIMVTDNAFSWKCQCKDSNFRTNNYGREAYALRAARKHVIECPDNTKFTTYVLQNNNVLYSVHEVPLSTTEEADV